MSRHTSHTPQHGFSMLEVLIAVLVFSLGMVGLGGLLIFALQSNHVAYLRTQATFLAHGMADRMSANLVGVWNGDYNRDYPTGDVQDCTGGCTPAQLAAYDRAIWSSQLQAFLPNVKASITCDAGGAGYAPNDEQRQMRPPYGGTCTMTLTWNESGAGSDRRRQPQTFAWVFQP